MFFFSLSFCVGLSLSLSLLPRCLFLFPAFSSRLSRVGEPTVRLFSFSLRARATRNRDRGICAPGDDS